MKLKNQENARDKFMAVRMKQAQNQALKHFEYLMAGGCYIMRPQTLQQIVRVAYLQGQLAELEWEHLYSE